jgi:hypothetical protein
LISSSHSHPFDAYEYSLVKKIIVWGFKCLPVHNAVGTNNEENLKDHTYLGLWQECVRGYSFYSLIVYGPM